MSTPPIDKAVEARLMEAWRSRVKAIGLKQSKNMKFMTAQCEFFVGAMNMLEAQALQIAPPLWILCILSGRDILAEYDRLRAKEQGDVPA